MAQKAHDEFPLLTPAAASVLLFTQANRHHADSPRQERRRLIADGIRGAMGQARTWKINSEFPKVIDATELEAIADNLHSPPPAPPKLEDLDQAVRELEGWNGGMEIRTNDWIRERIVTIRRGINHHCAERL